MGDNNQHDTTVRELTDRIVDARKKAGLSVEAAAIKLGMSRVQLWRLENKPNPQLTVTRLLRLAEIYDVDAAALLRGSIRASPPEIAYDRIHQVVLLVEETIRHKEIVVSSESIAAMVTEILKLESKRLSESPTRAFNPEAYVGLIGINYNKPLEQ